MGQRPPVSRRPSRGEGDRACSRGRLLSFPGPGLPSRRLCAFASRVFCLALLPRLPSWTRVSPGGVPYGQGGCGPRRRPAVLPRRPLGRRCALAALPALPARAPGRVCGRSSSLVRSRAPRPRAGAASPEPGFAGGLRPFRSVWTLSLPRGKLQEDLLFFDVSLRGSIGEGGEWRR